MYNKKNKVRAEKIDDPIHYIDSILEKANHNDLKKIY